MHVVKVTASSFVPLSLCISGSLPIVVWLKGPVLVQAQIFGLLVTQLCEVCVKRREMEAGHVLIWRARERRSTSSFSGRLSLFNRYNGEKEEGGSKGLLSLRLSLSSALSSICLVCITLPSSFLTSLLPLFPQLSSSFLFAFHTHTHTQL